MGAHPEQGRMLARHVSMAVPHRVGRLALAVLDTRRTHYLPARTKPKRALLGLAVRGLVGGGPPVESARRPAAPGRRAGERGHGRDPSLLLCPGAAPAGLGMNCPP